jgi:hypothetical protein
MGRLSASGSLLTNSQTPEDFQRVGRVIAHQNLACELAAQAHAVLEHVLRVITMIGQLDDRHHHIAPAKRDDARCEISLLHDLGRCTV